jgi:hypothetical protein
MATSPLPVKGCKIEAYARHSEQGGIFIVPHVLWHGASGFSGLIRMTAPISRLLQQAWGCGGPILTRILTGRGSVVRAVLIRFIVARAFLEICLTPCHHRNTATHPDLFSWRTKFSFAFEFYFLASCFFTSSISDCRQWQPLCRFFFFFARVIIQLAWGLVLKGPTASCKLVFWFSLPGIDWEIDGNLKHLDVSTFYTLSLPWTVGKLFSHVIALRTLVLLFHKIGCLSFAFPLSEHSFILIKFLCNSSRFCLFWTYFLRHSLQIFLAMCTQRRASCFHSDVTICRKAIKMWWRHNNYLADLHTITCFAYLKKIWLYFTSQTAPASRGFASLWHSPEPYTAAPKLPVLSACIFIYLKLCHWSRRKQRLFTVLRPVQEFITYMKTSPLLALSRKGSLSCHTCSDMWPRFFRSHPKDRPIQSPLTTKGMWRINFNPDPRGHHQYSKVFCYYPVTVSLVPEVLWTISASYDCKTTTFPILMHQMRISTTQISSVMLRSKKKKENCKRDVGWKPNRVPWLMII